MAYRIVIIGASGSGTTTIGKSLAAKLNIPHIETDDLFWVPAEIPYSKFRSGDELDKIVESELLMKESWVLSGSPCGWADAIIDLLDITVFLVVPTGKRIERITEREKSRFGDEILQGGRLFESHRDFLAWTKKYDSGGITGRTKTMHENWLIKLPCLLLRFEGEMDPNTIINKILDKIKSMEDLSKS